MKKKTNTNPRNLFVIASFKGTIPKLYTRTHKNKKDILNDRKLLKKEMKDDARRI